VPSLLAELQLRWEAARKRHAEAYQVFQKAQAEVQAAAAETQTWQNAVQFEQKEIDKAAALKQAEQPPLPLNTHSANDDATHVVIVEPQAEKQGPEINKTELVREAICRTGHGVTADEVWRLTGDQILDRPYMYSILKRLRDKGAVAFRRKKYYPPVQSLEVPEKRNSEMVQ
jgi:hypothetical protein